jgi:hypothetical protein
MEDTVKDGIISDLREVGGVFMMKGGEQVGA